MAGKNFPHIVGNLFMLITVRPLPH